MKKVKNTALNPDLMDKLSILGGNPGHIERMESEGQKELVASAQLPRKCNSPRTVTNIAEQYRKMGIQVLTTSKGDDIFLGVKLPAGWKKRETDHDMWSDLLDNKGRIRASIFYKAAFYDRSSHIDFNPRYYPKMDFSVKGEFTYLVMDGERVLFQSDRIYKSDPEYYQKQEEIRKQAVAFLDANYPNWEDINAYWD